MSESARKAVEAQAAQAERLRLVNALDLYRKGQEPGAAMRLAGMKTVKERAVFMMRVNQGKGEPRE